MRRWGMIRSNMFRIERQKYFCKLEMLSACNLFIFLYFRITWNWLNEILINILVHNNTIIRIIQFYSFILVMKYNIFLAPFLCRIEAISIIFHGIRHRIKMVEDLRSLQPSTSSNLSKHSMLATLSKLLRLLNLLFSFRPQSASRTFRVCKISRIFRTFDRLFVNRKQIRYSDWPGNFQRHRDRSRPLRNFRICIYF